MSLRMKVVLPLTAVATFLAFLISMIVLDALDKSIQASLSSSLRSTYALIRTTGLPKPMIGKGSSIGQPSILIVGFNGSGERIYPSSSGGSSAYVDLPLLSEDLPPVSAYNEDSYVGAVFEYQSEDITSLGVLVSTRLSQRVYAEVRIRLIVFSILAVLLMAIGGNLIGARLTKRINTLRQKVNQETSSESDRSEAQGDDVLGDLASDILGAQDRIATAQNEIARLQIVRSQFLANVSHEVRTPLFSLKGFLETLLDGGIDDPEVNRTFVSKALRHAQRIDNLLRDLIDIARIESGEMRMSFRYFQLATLVEQLQQDHADLAAKRQQVFVVDGSPESIEVVGDKDRLRQALSNLVENAMKYSPEGTTITLAIEPSEQTVRLKVVDNGPGIGPEHIGRVFERFYRISPDRSRELGGTGLGLAIVKHIIEAHGSDVSIESVPGEGTTFAFELRR